MNLENDLQNENLPAAANLPPATDADFRPPCTDSSPLSPGPCAPPSDLGALPALPLTDHGSRITPPSAPSSLAPAPDEPPQAFEAFLVYLNLTGHRRMINVAKATGASLRNLSRWAAEYAWVERVNRWRAAQWQAQRDACLCQPAEANLAWSDRSASVREREWEITDDLLQALHRRLQSADLDENSLARLARALTQVSKIARLSTGLAARPLDDSPGADPREAEFEAALQTAYGELPAAIQPSPASAAGDKVPAVNAPPKK